MRKGRRVLWAAILGLFCCLLAGCPEIQTRPKQPEAADAYEAAEQFLSALQTGDYDTAMLYLEEGDDLLYVLPAAQEGAESVPLMDPVYRQFCQRLGETAYSVSPEDTGLFDTVNVTIEQRDYGAAIRAAMLEAMDSQAKQGGDSFADLAGWMQKGVEQAQPGAEGTAMAVFAAKRGGHYLQHRGAPDQTFLNLLTGGFYDYADITMTTCSQTTAEGHEYRYYIAAAGDRVLACLLCEYYDGGPQDQQAVDAYQQEFIDAFASQPGIYQGVRMEDGKVVTSLGIDFEEANQTFLMNIGMVSGKYDSNFSADYLSLRSTVNSFEKSGMTCVTVPEYPEDPGR